MNNSEMNERIDGGENRGKHFGWGIVLFFIVLLMMAIVATALITFSYTINRFCYVEDENSAKLQTITKLIEDQAYGNPDYDKMLEEALRAYVGATGDKYTRYYTDEEFSALLEENEGNYVGIGVTVREETVVYQGNACLTLKILRVASDSPASAVGFSAGDYIYAVEDAEGAIKTVDELGQDNIVNLIRGEAGSKVKIYVLTGDVTSLQLKDAVLERKEVQSVSVEYSISETDPSVGIVKMYQFDLTTPVQLSAAIDSLKNQKIQKIVLDLRDNGGGDLMSVIACSSYFVNVGDIIVTSENKAGETDTRRAVRRNYANEYSTCSVQDEEIGKYKDLQIVTLVNNYTASAAELLTAVLRDYEVATSVGITTYGKGTMQTLFSLDDYGLEGGIKITTDCYYPPSGESYDGIGITPDVVVEAPEGFDLYDVLYEADDVQLLRAIEVLQNQQQ